MPVLDLARACHPQPTAAVTVLTTALFAAAGDAATTCLLGAFAVLTGQLSIGWNNDLIDRQRDLRAGRFDKPTVDGRLSAELLRGVTAAAVLLTVPLSLALGWLPGLLHLTAVGAGWLYNHWLKFTPLSVLPYLVAFGLLPIIATTALPEPRLPPAPVVLAAMLVGVAAHFANVLPDLAGDLVTGVRGLPQRIGLAGSVAVAALACLAATGLVLLVRNNWLTWFGLAAVAAAVLLALRLAVLRRVRAVFTAIIGCAALDVALIVASGGLR